MTSGAAPSSTCGGTRQSAGRWIKAPELLRVFLQFIFGQNWSAGNKNHPEELPTLESPLRGSALYSAALFIFHVIFSLYLSHVFTYIFMIMFQLSVHQHFVSFLQVFSPEAIDDTVWYTCAAAVPAKFV